MSFSGYNVDGPTAWGTPAPLDGIVKDALKKEQLLREIAASQDDLRKLLGRVQTVQKEVENFTSENETLQMYIDNLTVQMAKRR